MEHKTLASLSNVPEHDSAMVTAYVSVGSNLDRERNILHAVNALGERFGELAVSPVYDSPAIGFDGPPFFNLAVGFTTSHGVESVSESLTEIERACGRTSDMAGFVDRTVDLDLLLYGDLRRHDDTIDVPRFELLVSPHMLKPLLDLDPHLVHPETGQALSGYWPELESTLDEPMQVVTVEFG